MIKVNVNERHAVCNSCGHDKNIKSIKVSRTGHGWTTIMLCDNCIAELINTVKEEGGSVG